MPTTSATTRRNIRRRASFAAAASEARRTGNISAKIAIMPRMVKDVMLGRWGKDTGAQGTLLLVAGAFLYLLSPIDILPEAVLLLPGFLDDAAIALFAANKLFTETEHYMWDNGMVPPPIKVEATRVR